MFMLYVMTLSSNSSFYDRSVESDSQQLMRLLHWYELQTPDIKLRRHILGRFAAEIYVWTA